MGSTFPYGTLIINASGSFLIGLILAAVSERAPHPWWVRPTFAIGFLGFVLRSRRSATRRSLATKAAVALATVNVFGSVMGALAERMPRHGPRSTDLMEVA